MTEREVLKLALEALKYPLNQSHENFNVDMAELLAHRAITAIKEALAQPEQEPVVWMYQNKSTHGVRFQKHMRDFVDHGAWHEVPLYSEPLANQEKTSGSPIKEVLAQPEQDPVAWKLVPIKPTDEMLKAMDESSTEGYDERLYAGHAASVYMAAVDVAPTPPQRKPLSDDEIILIVADCATSHQHTDIHFARAIEAAVWEKQK